MREKRKIRLAEYELGERETENKGEGEVKHWQHTAAGFLHRGFCYTLVVISLTNNLHGGLSVRT